MKSDGLNDRTAVLPDNGVLQAELCVAYLQALRELAARSDKASATVSFVASHGVTGEEEGAGAKPVVVEVPLASLTASPSRHTPAVNRAVPAKRRKDPMAAVRSKKTWLSRWRAVSCFAGAEAQAV